MTDPDLTATPPLGLAVVRLPPEFPVARPARGARFLASAFILLSAGVAVLAAWQSWHSYQLVLDVYSPVPKVTDEELVRATDRGVLLSYAWLAGVALSGAAFLMWLWRARINSARICDAPQRLRIRWALLSWFIPLGNLWLPQMVLGDLWRASRPDTPPRGADLRTVPAGRLIAIWWGLFVLMHAIDLFAVNLLVKDDSPKTFESVFYANAITGGLAVVTAVLILVIMRRVDRWQADRDMIR
ncbi:DUF4328 domain-containing protein [Actinokineospora sp. NBRC 105648]|uniref:DUF4328 domain-containing protein n=1 Tax=Actinokineospora sp. NBRC 105648 TaxID=3032206 RepID=UPI00255621D2|nr:DUF4328 domain-containing protein [Actinokineospora sp. NBRC 105648]